jgi:lauroyl/myristoyl acyltransferase
MLRLLTFRVIRAAGGRLPLPVIEGALYPVALARALLDILRPRRRVPRSLPPDRTQAPFLVDLRERTVAWMNTAALFWADRFNRSPWLQRIELSGVAELRPVIVDRPALIATVHFGGIFALPSLLRAFDIPTAAVVAETLWPVRWWREQRARLTVAPGLPVHLRSGDARQIMRYLEPGRCLLVALDYPLGEQLTTDFGGAALRLSTASFRLARITGAAVVPAIVRVNGPWRFAVHVGRPVPDEMLASGDDAAVLAHVVRELLPVAAVRPEQALPLLVNAFEQSAA